MKKIYFIISILSIGFNASAQLSLTKAFNEPVIGDINTKIAFDSVGVLNNSIGSNQNWDFSTLVVDTIIDISTFTTVASTPNGANYSGSTLASDEGGGTFNYFKSTATQYELVGIDDPNLALDLTNTAIVSIWPVTMGYSNTDLFSGTANTTQAGSGPATGTVTTIASGTGSLTLPGGTIYSNVLQIKAIQNVEISLAFGLFSVNLTTTEYNYYHSTQKFPLLTVNYTDITGAINSSSSSIRINSSVVAGIKSNEFDNSFSLFPNPAKSKFNVKLKNTTAANGMIEVLNALGESVLKFDLGNSVDISANISVDNLSAGVYFVKTTFGNNVSNKKLIIE